MPHEPTDDQIKTVRKNIKDLMEARYGWPDEEGFLPTDMGNLLIPGKEGLSWKEIEGMYGEPLAYHVDWEGFTEAQEETVSQRVIAGLPPDQWMEGIHRELTMPTDEQMEGVVLDVTNLQTAPFKVSFGEITVDASWDDLSPPAMHEFLDRKVRWEGFSQEQIADVQIRIISGEDRAVWFDDIRIELEVASYDLEREAEIIAAERLVEREQEEWDGSVTKALVEWELDKVHAHYYDDGSDPPHDYWSNLSDTTRLEIIYKTTSIRTLSSGDARNIFDAELILNNVADVEQRAIFRDDYDRLATRREEPDAPGQELNGIGDDYQPKFGGRDYGDVLKQAVERSKYRTRDDDQERTR